MKTRLPILVIMAIICFGFSSVYGDAKQEAWLKKAQLGNYAPSKQDWSAIEKAARKEGKVVIYSLSSRIFKLQEEFKKKYGVEIVAYDLASGMQLERFKREHRAGRHSVDVLFNREIPLILDDYLPRKLVWNFVPDDVAKHLDKREKSPLLIQRWSSRVVFYNRSLHPNQPPINSLWDLTKKEWKGKILLLDPLSSTEDANAFQTILQHPEEMEAAYKREFGGNIKYSKDLLEVTQELGLQADAAKEWFYRVLTNKPVFLGSTTTVFKNVGDVKQKRAPIGITTFSKMRTNKKGVYNAYPIFDLDPVTGISAPVTLVVADRAPHPNAAKLLIRYMMNEGFNPWDVHGDFAAREDVMAKQVKKYGRPSYDEMKKWEVDSNYVNSTRFEFLELYINLR